MAAVRVNASTMASVASVKNAAGVSFTAIPGTISGSANNSTQLFYLPNTTGNATDAVTANFSPNQSFIAICVWEISGADLSSPLDATASAVLIAGNATITSSPFSTSVLNEIILAVASEATTSTTWTQQAGYSLDSASFPVVSGSVGAEHLLVNSIQTNTTSSMTANKTTSILGMSVATFKAAVASTPTFSPNGGSFGPSQTVTITSSAGTTIFYTTDGSTPNHSSTSIASGATITVSVTSTVKAIGYSTDLNDSAVGSASFTINGATGTPVFNPVAGTYGSTQNVTITSANSTTITYTTDGTTPIPGSHGTVYSGPVVVASSLTIKAIGSAVNWSNSAEGDAAYVISGGGGGSSNSFGLLNLLGVN